MQDEPRVASTPNVYTPKTLSERWLCSERHVRNMIASGDIQAFNLGGKLLRISVAEVQRYEAEGVVKFLQTGDRP